MIVIQCLSIITACFHDENIKFLLIQRFRHYKTYIWNRIPLFESVKNYSGLSQNTHGNNPKQQHVGIHNSNQTNCFMSPFFVCTGQFDITPKKVLYKLSANRHRQPLYKGYRYTKKISHYWKSAPMRASIQSYSKLMVKLNRKRNHFRWILELMINTISNFFAVLIYFFWGYGVFSWTVI